MWYGRETTNFVDRRNGSKFGFCISYSDSSDGYDYFSSDSSNDPASNDPASSDSSSDDPASNDPTSSDSSSDDPASS